MVKLNEQFKAEEHAKTDFSPLPNGTYKAVIKDSQGKTSKAGHPYLSFTIEVIDGPHKGRLLWGNVNNEHPNETTRRIANGTLRAMVDAVGKKQISDTSELHNLPLLVEVTQQKRQDTGEMQNRIKSYRSLASQPVGEASQTTEKKPWER